MKETLWIASTFKIESFETLINHQWSFAWYGYCPMKDQFQMHSNWERTPLQTELFSLSCSRDKKHGSGDSGCTPRTNVLCQRSLRNTHPMPSNPFKIVVASLFQSSAVVRQDWIQSNNFWNFKLLLLMNYSFWWFLASDKLASDDVITSGALCLQEQFSSDALSFLFVDSFALYCSSKTFLRYHIIFYTPVHLNKY